MFFCHVYVVKGFTGVTCSQCSIAWVRVNKGSRGFRLYVLPGISFYCHKSIAYTLEIKRKTIPKMPFQITMDSFHSNKPIRKLPILRRAAEGQLIKKHFGVAESVLLDLIHTTVYLLRPSANVIELDNYFYCQENDCFPFQHFFCCKSCHHVSALRKSMCHCNSDESFKCFSFVLF